MVQLAHGTYLVDSVDGDGNCLIRAIARQLEGGGEFASDAGYPEVRRKLVAYASDESRMDEHIAEFRVYLPRYPRLMSPLEEVRKTEWRRIMRRMATDGEWDDE